MTRGEFARHFLHGIGADAEHEAMLACVCWMAGEGGYAKNNPLNTTLWKPGSTVYNYAYVRNYPTPAVGIEATCETLNYGADRFKYGYRPIRRRLRKGNNAERILKAVDNSDWGTGGIALAVLADVRAGRQQFETLRKVSVAG